MKRTFVFGCVLLLVTSAMAKMEFRQDETADFSSFHTYRFIEGAPAVKEGVEKQIVKSVNANLQALGLKRVEGDADLDVSTYVLTDTNVDLWSNVAVGQYGETWNIQVRDTTDGQLILRITRGGTHDLVWHASEERVVASGQTAQQLERMVAKIIDKMFTKYPGAKKRKK